MLLCSVVYCCSGTIYGSWWKQPPPIRPAVFAPPLKAARQCHPRATLWFAAPKSGIIMRRIFHPYAHICILPVSVGPLSWILAAYYLTHIVCTLVGFGNRYHLLDPCGSFAAPVINPCVAPAHMCGVGATPILNLTIVGQVPLEPSFFVLRAGFEMAWLILALFLI
jgi:hypothetical protein